MRAAFVGYEHETGFGLVKTEKFLGARPVKLGTSANLEAGEPVLVSGQGGAKAVLGAYVASRAVFAASWEHLLENAIVTIPAYANFGGAVLIGRDGSLFGGPK